jgi:hypothetical protein
MTVQNIIIKADKESQYHLKNLVRKRLEQKPKLGGFSCGMGVHFFSFVNNEIDHDGVAARTKEILNEFSLHTDSFGSFPWRVYLVNGKYIERTDC